MVISSPSLKHLFVAVFLLSAWFESSVGGERAILNVNSVNQTQVLISWTPLVLSGNQTVLKYNVKAQPLKWFSTSHVAMEMALALSNRTLQALLSSLQPGTKYNVSVQALTQKGLVDLASTILWTEVGLPETPSPVEILKRDGVTMKIKLQPGKSENGPITGIQVVVLRKTTIVSFNQEQLFNSSLAEESEIPFYVAAIIYPDLFNPEFTVGDGRTYGGYFNAPLREDASYEVLEGVISTLNGVTKTAYSPFMPDTVQYAGNYNTDESAPDNSGLTTVLAIAVGVFGFLLVASVLLYFLLRRHYGKRRPSDELVLNDHIGEGEENGCIPGMLQLGADANLGDFWDLLVERYPIIPRGSLEVGDVVQALRTH